MTVYSSLLAAVLILGGPYWLFRMATSGRYRAGLAGRLGRVPETLRAVVAGRNVVWMHAVSVGEVLAATRLVAELKASLGDSWVVVVSTTTATGHALAQQKLGAATVFYLPLDFAFSVRRYLRALQPKMMILMESELWPRLIHECAANGVAVAVANARISDRSFPRYLRLRTFWKPFLAKISLYLAQSPESAERFARIGAPKERIRMTGNLKYDVRENAANAMTTQISSLLHNTRLIVAGSTLANEEEMLLAAWPAIQKAMPGSAILIAPRHPDRFDQVLSMIRATEYPFLRCSQLSAAQPIANGTILLLDTIGDLASMYRIATAAFVGGSLVPKGGHNPLEPAQFGVPVVMGPWYENFREVVERMLAADGIQIIKDRAELGPALIALMTHPVAATAMGDRGRKVFEAQTGATGRTVQALLALLHEQTAPPR
jgi:3-deoxy-D-manno-octulosonic-acid transferase